VTESAAEKRVSWAELFFDLVFVYALTEVSALLAADHSWAGLLRALIVFVPVYWAWVGAAIISNQRDTARPSLRLVLFGVALAALFMALAVPEAYTDRGVLYASAYWAGRLLMASVHLRDRLRGVRLPVNPHVISAVLTGPLLLAGGFTHGDVREALWGLAALIELAALTVLRSRLRGMHFDSAHLAERFGAFVLIALGESVVAIGASAHPLNVPVGFAVAAAFALSCGLWWVYFNYAADAVRHALATAPVQVDITRLVLSYGHLSFIAAIILVAGGMHQAVSHPTHHLSWAFVGLLGGGTALYLATFGFTRWAMFRLVSVTRLTAAAVVVVLLPVLAHLPAVLALGALALVVGVLNVVEWVRVERSGFRAALARRRSTVGDAQRL
jgi:low temperature requirement protein LtrA